MDAPTEDATGLQTMCQLMVASASEGMYGVDARGITTFVNPAVAQITGWTAEELLGKPHEQFVAAGMRPGEDALFLRKDGTRFPAACTRTPVYADGSLSATVIVFQDISEKRRAEQWEHTRSFIFSAILGHEALPCTLRMIADAFVARYPARSIAIFLRREGALHLEAEAGPASRASAEFDRALQTASQVGEWLSPGVALRLGVSLVSSGEDRGLVAIFGSDAALDDGVRGTVQRVCDLACVAIEHSHLYEEAAQRALTGQGPALPGRMFVESCLREAMVAAQRRGKRIAVCCLHLDRLKQMSALRGVEFAEALVTAVCDRLNRSVRDVDVPARYVGDEFLLAICDLSLPSEAEDICQRLLKELQMPLSVTGQLVAMTGSIGVSLYPDHGDTPEVLLRHAGIALQEVKQASRGNIQVYSAVMGVQSRRAAEMPEALLSAITGMQFHMAYQPIFSMSGAIAGFEALLRWNHPDWGSISPLDFIATAERTGLIVPIGDWVIEEVCRQAIAWDAASLPAVRMFANVSGVQLERPDFSSKIASALLRSGLSADRLELEITESWVISDLQGAAHKLLLLRELGIGIAIDDFGTGYSTFNYLQELPIDTIKIDRSFTQRLDGRQSRPSTARAITGMAQQMGLKIVAEGVETPEQAAELGAIGCDLMQGFLLGRPLAPQDAFALLQKQQVAGPIAIAACQAEAAEFTQSRS